MGETCPKSEYLAINPEIFTFCEAILSKKEIKEAIHVSEDLVSSKKIRELAREKLKSMVGERPKRPMFYLNDELGSLPRHTRNCVRYLGDYIDHLIKFCANEKLKKKKNLTKSLGTNLRELKTILPETVHSKLVRYNELIYVPAKHDFDVTGRKHYFTSKEVVFICFTTLKLSKQITKISSLSKDYAENKIYA